jgi:hypothetical protein
MKLRKTFQTLLEEKRDVRIIHRAKVRVHLVLDWLSLFINRKKIMTNIIVDVTDGINYE